ncbi:hypothetical protein [Marinobacterium sedimentorum]|uniref:hypothetical protein n=1 Tax=Marinobacterium sedimentorum TaxID=2927804 RepID=UPI0020C64BF6|nr:hypothetical protein [Marinobacterium sedimentorum]MCP8687720.1 hypothetical protein [Marinobacterium sedimentorum]
MTDKGGPLARRAALLCNDVQFRLYLDRRRRAKFQMDIPDGTHNAQDARDFILGACGITSRAELDHNPDAARRFGDILTYYHRYRRRLNQSRMATL